MVRILQDYITGEYRMCATLLLRWQPQALFLWVPPAATWGYRPRSFKSVHKLKATLVDLLPPISVALRTKMRVDSQRSVPNDSTLQQFG